jgi:Peptidase inhibitor I78 family
MRTIPTALLIVLAGCGAQPAADSEPAPEAQPAAEAEPPAEAEPAQAPETATGGPERACDASKAQSLLGRSESADTEAEAKRLSGAGIVRWIPEGGMVTMDYREDRLNLRLDGAGKIVGIDCG